MKRTLLSLTTLSLAFAVAANAAEDTALPPGQIDFGKFSTDSGGQLVEINLNSALINVAAQVAAKADPEAVKVLSSLKSIRVSVVGMNDKNSSELKERIDSIRKQLREGGWERVVTVQEKNDDVGIYTKMRGNEAVEGIVITVIGGKKEAVFINLVGDIRPEQLASIAEKLNIAPLKQVAAAIGGKK